MQWSKALLVFFLLISKVYGATNAFVAGGIATINDKTQPLILSATNSTTWSAWPLISGMPEGFASGHLASSICQNDQCYMVGSYSLQNGVHWPMLLEMNQEHEISLQVIEGLPQNMTEGFLRQINCANNVCIAVGSYYSGDIDMPNVLRSYSPLIVTSDDYGQSWSVRAIDGLPANRDNTNLNQIVCTETRCIAAGSITLYTPGKAPAYISAPLFLQSDDQGQSWFYSPQAINLSNTVVSTYLEKIICRAGFCIAVGNYKDYESGNSYIPKPLLITSQDNGSTWAAEKSLPQQFSGWTQLIDVSCTDASTCIVAGVHKKQDWQTLILVSHDNGKTWTSNKSGQRPYIAVDNISCTTNFCAISGFSPDFTDIGLLVSHDAGDTWSVKKITRNCPDYQDNGYSESLVCHDAECVLAGRYFNGHSLPLLVESHDSGDTWSCVNTIANYPNVSEGSLTTAANGSF